MSKLAFVRLLVFFASFGGFLFGFNTSVISGALLQLEVDFALTTAWKQGVVSSTVGSAAVCSLASGFLNSLIGRRRLFLVSGATFVAGALCSALAPNKEVLLVGRLILGVGVGFVSATSPVYISEVAPANVRGRLTTVNTLFLTGGQFAAGVVGGAFITLPGGWRFMFGVAAFPAAVMFLAFLFLPESPRWLVSKDLLAEAKAVLLRIRDSDEAEKELQAMIESQSKDNLATGSTISKMLKTRSTRRALLVGCGLQMIQQVIGINTVMYYSASVIKLSGVSSLSAAAWLAALVASINFIFTVVGVFAVEGAGRRRLTLVSLFGVTGSLAVLAVGFQVSAFASPAVTNRLDISPFNNNDNNNHNNNHDDDGFDHANALAFANECAGAEDCISCTRRPNCGFCYQTVDEVIGNSSCLQAEEGNQSSHSPPSAAPPCPGLTASAKAGEGFRWATDFCPSPYSWVVTVGMVIYLAFFAPGMGPMPWTINAEIYPSWARSTGNGLATCTNWLFNLLISTTFLTLIEVLEPHGAFWLYCVLSALGCLFVFFTLPETREKSLEEIENIFQEKT